MEETPIKTLCKRIYQAESSASSGFSGNHQGTWEESKRTRDSAKQCLDRAHELDRVGLSNSVLLLFSLGGGGGGGRFSCCTMLFGMPLKLGYPSKAAVTSLVSRSTGPRDPQSTDSAERIQPGLRQVQRAPHLEVHRLPHPNAQAGILSPRSTWSTFLAGSMGYFEESKSTTRQSFGWTSNKHRLLSAPLL